MVSRQQEGNLKSFDIKKTTYKGKEMYIKARINRISMYNRK